MPAKLLQSCLILHDPADCSPPGPSVYGILQARIQDWVTISSSRGPSGPRNQICMSCGSCIGRWILRHRATGEARNFIYMHFLNIYILMASLQCSERKSPLVCSSSFSISSLFMYSFIPSLTCQGQRNLPYSFL